MSKLNLQGRALAWLLAAVCVVVACSNKTETHAGDAGSGASQGGPGGSSGMPSISGSGGTSSEDASLGTGGDVAGASGADAAAGAAGAITGAGGEGAPSDAGADAADAASDAASADAQSDASEEGGAGAPSDAGIGGTGGAPPKDAGVPPPDCSPPDDDAAPPASDAGAATRQVIQNLVNTRCVYCHVGPTPPMGLDLTDIAAVAGTHSKECPSKLRIEAGSAKNSYLIDKLLGQSQAPCGCFKGQQMPLDDDPLGDDDLRAIQSWINAGAH